MDAVEYLETKRRLCKAHTECRGCPLNIEECRWGTGCMLGELVIENVEDLVARVEKWAKEHPFRTRQSVFLDRYPNAKIDEDGSIVICPSAIEGKSCYELYDGMSCCKECRSNYWSQETDE